MDVAQLPLTTKQFRDKHLVVSYTGHWDVLTKDELEELRSQKYSEQLKERLLQSGVLIAKENLNRVLDEYRTQNANLFQGPSLHIVELTTQCNLDCNYCHANSPVNENKHMSKDTALKVLNMVFSAQNKAMEIEFQGGEPLLNWDTLKYIVEQTHELNKLEEKDMSICVMSNLTLLTENKAKWLIEKGCRFSTSLDGPAIVHDKNRPFHNAHVSTHELVTKKLHMLKELSPNVEFGAVPTITKHSLAYPEEIVDEYVKLGMKSISLRHLNYLGVAMEKWDEIGYTANEFNEFYTKAMDHILELNKKGIMIAEYQACVILQKTLLKQDAGYTEMMSPCGAGRTQITYGTQGDVYTCDEGRMVDNDLFKMGNVHDDTPETIMGADVISNIANVSNLKHYCGPCTYNSWCGTCPVLNYTSQGSLIPRIRETMRHKIYYHMFNYIFDKIIHDEEARVIFQKWTELFDRRPQGCHLD